MFVVATNQVISGTCDSSSWAASVMALPVSLAISSSLVECILVPLMSSERAPRVVVMNSIASSRINSP